MTQDSPNHSAVTQEDVAQRAGVTRSVVSYVINNGPRSVSEETRARVLAAIKELGYRPNKHAQMLSSADDRVADRYLGIILARNYMFRRPYYGSILASMHEYAHERDCHIRFIRVFDDFTNPALFNELIHPDEISGAILVGLDQVISSEEDRDLVREIVRRVERVVCVDWEWQGVPSIIFDRQNAAYQAVQHLIDRQRRRIAYIGPDDKRLTGYHQALWERGITPDSALIRFAVDTHAGCSCCDELLGTQGRFDAVFAGTDEVAIGVLKSLNRGGRAVPGDVMVASIDNLDITEFTIPSLTTIDVHKRQIGLHAIETLLAERNARPSSAYTISVPTQLIVRESTTYSP